MHLPPEDVRALSQTEISQLMLATANPWTYDAVRGTTDMLVNGGKPGVLSVRSDPILMGYSKRFHINAACYIEELNLIRDQIEELLALIDESD